MTNDQFVPPSVVCPVWCVSDHTDQRYPDDAWHMSQGITIPIIEHRTVFREGAATHLIVGSDLDVVLEQHVDSSEPFLFVGIGDERPRSFRLTLESARRLIPELERAIGLAWLPRHTGDRATTVSVDHP